MYLADYHIHSTGSPDGKCTIREMAEEAIRKGLQEICITDHLDTIYWDGRPRTDYDWESALEQLREAREACGDRIVLMLGNQVELWEIVLAAIKIGAVIIPASTLLTPDDLPALRAGAFGPVQQILKAVAEVNKLGGPEKNSEATTVADSSTV